MKSKLASEVKPGDRLMMARPVDGQAHVVRIVQTTTEVKSKKGEFGAALMILFHIIGAPRKKFAEADFVHPNDRIEIP